MIIGNVITSELLTMFIVYVCIFGGLSETQLHIKLKCMKLFCSESKMFRYLLLYLHNCVRLFPSRYIHIIISQDYKSQNYVLDLNRH